MDDLLESCLGGKLEFEMPEPLKGWVVIYLSRSSRVPVIQACSNEGEARQWVYWGEIAGCPTIAVCPAEKLRELKGE